MTWQEDYIAIRDAEPNRGRGFPEMLSEPTQGIKDPFLQQGMSFWWLDIAYRPVPMLCVLTGSWETRYTAAGFAGRYHHQEDGSVEKIDGSRLLRDRDNV